MDQKVFAIFVSYNPEHSFVRNVERILHQGVWVIVVDNGSSLPSLTHVRALEAYEKVIVLHNKTNMGIATALNQGVKKALELGAEYLFTFDQDSLAPNNFVSAMMGAWMELEARGIRVGCLGPSWIDQVTEPEEVNNREEMYSFPEYIISSGMLINRATVAMVGPFRDDFFIDYVDVEFCLRCQQYGLRVAQFSGICLVHKLGNFRAHSIGGRKFYATHHNYVRRYYITRNRMLTWRAFARDQPSWFLRDLKASLIEGLKVLLVEDDKLRKVVSMLRGCWDALQGKTGMYA